MNELSKRASNPLDWSPIDRQILLGSLLLLAPVVFGGWLLATLALAPDYLNNAVATLLLGLYGLQTIALIGFLILSLGKRRHCQDWPLFENFIVVSFLANVFASGYASGTVFSQGLLVCAIGLNVATALISIRKIYFAYVSVAVFVVLAAISDFGNLLPVAPLFAKSPLNADGGQSPGWLAIQVLIAIVLLAITRISIAVIRRWLERENLYREMSTIDGLTRLSNRRSFIERGMSEFQRAQRMTLKSVACVMVDLDHFKSINDTWGHHAGDQVLVAASNVLMESTRQYDEVGRYGGEEFAILMPGLTLEEATVAAERIRENIAAVRVDVDGQQLSITASLGVACFPGTGIMNLNDLLKSADQALYQAKESGRNQVVTAG